MLKVLPIAFESLGARSTCTKIVDGAFSMVIDPAVALAPKRYGLTPHPLELKQKKTLWGRIKGHVSDAEIIVVTHYHFDHVDPNNLEIYAGKRVFLKHPRKMINRSQKERAASILPRIKEYASEIIYADGRNFRLNDIEVAFSKPLPHGSTATRGFVIGVSIKADENFIYTSDVQGPILDEQVDFIVSQKPDVLVVDGPSTYIDSPSLEIEIEESKKNLISIIEEGTERLIVDHHLTRDLRYREKINTVFKVGEEQGVAVECAAEFLNVAPNLLEARRKELYSTGEEV